MKENSFRYVVRHFKSDALNPDIAFSHFCERTGYRVKHFSLRYAAVAAMLLLLAGVAVMYFMRQQTTVIEAGNSLRTIVFSDGTEVILAPHAIRSYKKDDELTSLHH